jgi:hypothetical protein
MGIFYISLIDHRIAHGGVNLYMPQEPLHLLNGHPFVNGPGGKGAPEFMRVRLLCGLSAERAQPCFHSTYHQAFMRFCQRDKQGRIVIRPAFQVIVQMDFGSGVKIGYPLAVALAEHHAFTLVKIDILPGKLNKLAYPHAS